MAAGIEVEKGDWMASGRGLVPWHTIGTVVEGLMEYREVLKTAKLDWTVVKEPAYRTSKVSKKSSIINDGEFFWIVRKDTDRVLGCVGEQYEPTQHTTDLAMIEDLVGNGDAIYDTAGSLWGGKRVWIMAKVPKGTFWLKRKGKNVDEVEDYFLLTDSHDGSSSLTLANVGVRVVCQNTLTMALSGARSMVKLRHTRTIEARAQEAKRALSINLEYVEALRGQSQALLDKPADNEFVKAFLNTLVPIPEVEEDARQTGVTRAKNTQTQILNIFKDEPNLETVRGTQWALLQSVVQYNDYKVGGRNTGGEDGDNRAENRFNRVLFSDNLATKAARILIPAKAGN